MVNLTSLRSELLHVTNLQIDKPRGCSNQGLLNLGAPHPRGSTENKKHTYGSVSHQRAMNDTLGTFGPCAPRPRFQVKSPRQKKNEQKPQDLKPTSQKATQDKSSSKENAPHDGHEAYKIIKIYFSKHQYAKRHAAFIFSLLNSKSPCVLSLRYNFQLKSFALSNPALQH